MTKKRAPLHLILLFIHLISTSIYLNVEIVNNDMSTFLIAGQDILRGNLPYENQFEIKGPVLYIMYAIFVWIASENILIIKYIISFLVYLISYILFDTILDQTKNLKLSFLASLIFLLLMSSKGLGQSGYSELIALIFLSLGFKYFLKNEYNSQIILSGFLFGLSTLTSFGTIIFVPIITFFYFLDKSLNSLKVFLSGFFFPHIVFLLIYISKSKFYLYKFALFDLPIQYTTESYIQHNLHHYILMVTEEVKHLDILLMVTMLVVIYSILNNYKFLMLIFASYFIFFISGSGAVHHLIFLVYLFCLSFMNIKYNLLENILLIPLIIVTLIFAFSFSGNAISNYLNDGKFYENYPIRNLADELKNQTEDKNYTILAYENHLVLYYLNKPNLSYVIHPSLAVDKIANDSLKNYLNIDTSFKSLLDTKPKYIFCDKNLVSCNFDNYKEMIFSFNDDQISYFVLTNP